MSMDYQELQNVRENAAPGNSAGFSLCQKQGFTMSRGVSLPRYLICALFVVYAVLLLLIIILVVAMTNSGVRWTEQRFDSKLGNLSATLNSITEHLSHDGAIMMEKVKHIEATVKDSTKECGMRWTEQSFDSKIKNLNVTLNSITERLSHDGAVMMEKIKHIEATMKDITKDCGMRWTEQSFDSKIENLNVTLNSIKEHLSHDGAVMMEKVKYIEATVKDTTKDWLLRWTEQSFDSKLGNLNATLNSIMEHLSHDGAVMMEKVKHIEATVKDCNKDIGVRRTEQSFDSKLGNLSASLNSITEHLSHDGAVMMEKVKHIEAKVNDCTNDSAMMQKLTEMDASVQRILSDEVTGSFQSDVQRILDAIGRMREEMRKENGTQDPLCSLDWSHYAMSCYYLSTTMRTWAGAKKDCENRKAHLVVINSAEEQDFVGGMTRDRRTWIGLTDADGSWKWLDGTPYESSPKFWRPGQPDNWFGHGLGGGEDCGQLWSFDTKYSWNDDHCSRRFQYICEKKL